MLRPTSPSTARPVGHADLTHDHWTDLGHDWSRVGDPEAPSEHPAKVYLPTRTVDVVDAVRETRRLGQPLVVRGAAHSSNGLVTAPAGAVLLTTGMDRVVAVDAVAGTVTVQPGASVVAVDELLATHGLGLHVVPDHPDITAGGFASVGGLGPTSLHHGMFVDAVEAVEYVTPEGTVRRCGREEGGDELLRLLGGLGRHGVLTELTLRVARADKRGTVLRNDRARFTDATALVAATTAVIAEPGDAVAVRASWLDLPIAGGIGRGVLSVYEPAPRPHAGRVRARAAYGVLRGLGRLSTTLPPALGTLAKYAATAGLMRAPRYATGVDVQRFSDGVLDWTVGDPTRLLVALAPVGSAPVVFDGMLRAALDLRDRESSLTFVSIHVKGVRSPYLSGGDPDQVHVELLMVVGLDAHWMTPRTVPHLADEVDRVCREHGALRYMHTLSAGGCDLDPNARYWAPVAVGAT